MTLDELIGSLPIPIQNYAKQVFDNLHGKFAFDFTSVETFLSSLASLKNQSLDPIDRLYTACGSSFYLPYINQEKIPEIVSHIQSSLGDLVPLYKHMHTTQQDFILKLKYCSFAAITAKQLFTVAEDNAFSYIDSIESISYDIKRLLMIMATSLRERHRGTGRALSSQARGHLDLTCEVAFDVLVLLWVKAKSATQELHRLGFFAVIARGLASSTRNTRAFELIAQFKELHSSKELISLLDPKVFLSLPSPLLPPQAKLIIEILTTKIEMSKEVNLKVAHLKIILKLMQKYPEVRDCVKSKAIYPLLIKNFFIRTDGTDWCLLHSNTKIDDTTQFVRWSAETISIVDEEEIFCHIIKNLNRLVASPSAAAKVFALCLGEPLNPKEPLEGFATHYFQEYALLSLHILGMSDLALLKEIVEAPYFLHSIWFARKSLNSYQQIEKNRTVKYGRFLSDFYELYFGETLVQKSIDEWYTLVDNPPVKVRFAHGFILKDAPKSTDKLKIAGSTERDYRIRVIKHWMLELKSSNSTELLDALLSITCTIYDLTLAPQKNIISLINSQLNLFSAFQDLIIRTQGEKISPFCQHLVETSMKNLVSPNLAIFNINPDNLSNLIQQSSKLNKIEKIVMIMMLTIFICKESLSGELIIPLKNCIKNWNQAYPHKNNAELEIIASMSGKLFEYISVKYHQPSLTTYPASYVDPTPISPPTELNCLTPEKR